MVRRRNALIRHTRASDTWDAARALMRRFVAVRGGERAHCASLSPEERADWRRQVLQVADRLDGARRLHEVAAFAKATQSFQRPVQDTGAQCLRARVLKWQGRGGSWRFVAVLPPAQPIGWEKNILTPPVRIE